MFVTRLCFDQYIKKLCIKISMLILKIAANFVFKVDGCGEFVTTDMLPIFTYAHPLKECLSFLAYSEDFQAAHFQLLLL